MPGDDPKFGNSVLTRDSNGAENSFSTKNAPKEGICLCWDASGIQRGYAMTTREDGSTTLVAASAPRPWPRPLAKEVWHIEEEPDGPGRIWMISKGRIMWNAPTGEDAVTF